MNKFSTLTIFNHKKIKSFCVVGFQNPTMKEEFQDFTGLYRDDVDIKISLSIFKQLFEWNEDKTSAEVLNMFLSLYPNVIGFSFNETNSELIRKVVMHGRMVESDDGNLYGLYSFILTNRLEYETGFGIHIDSISDDVYNYLLGMTQNMQDECSEIIRRAKRSGIDPVNYLETFFGF